MKKWMLTLLSVAVSLWTMAQQPDTNAAYKRFPTLPPINLLQVDSSTLTKENLKQQSTIIMFFSPGCDHCQLQWEDMVKHKEDLKNFQIVMATYESFEEMEDFYKKHQIASYPNIKMGRDIKFTLPPFYRMRSLPYQALYDKKGNLITTFEGNVAIDKMIAAFKGK